MKKVKYKCLGCGWSKILPSDWGDVKPRFCPTSACEMSVKKSKGRKSFRSHPDMLQVTTFEDTPTKEEVAVKTISYEEKPSGRDKKSKRNERAEPAASGDTEAADKTGTFA